MRKVEAWTHYLWCCVARTRPKTHWSRGVGAAGEDAYTLSPNGDGRGVRIVTLTTAKPFTGRSCEFRNGTIVIGRANIDVGARICHKPLWRAICLVMIRPAGVSVVSVVSSRNDYNHSILVHLTQEFFKKVSVIGIFREICGL